VSVALIGGLLLIAGAFLTMKGKIYWAVGVYFVADICWVIISLGTGDFIGASLVVIGMLLGLIAFIKMNTGKMRKTLNEEQEG